MQKTEAVRVFLQGGRTFLPTITLEHSEGYDLDKFFMNTVLTWLTVMLSA